MHGFSIDQRPDAPVGTPDTRRTVAIHWHWTTEYSTEEIGKALGVSERTVEKYLESTPAEEVRKQLEDIEAEVRYVAVKELKEQLRAAGHRSKTAESPAKVWEDSEGNLRVKDVTDDDGELVKRVPIPADIELMPDEEARYYARAEVRDILDQLTELLGIAEPEQVEVDAEHSGEVQLDHEHGFDEETDRRINEMIKALGDGDE